MGCKPTSIRAYRDHIASGAALTQRDRIFAWIDAHPGHTRLEISRQTGITINAVCGRVAELRKAWFVEELPARPCHVSGRTSCPLRVRRNVLDEPSQLPLPGVGDHP